MALPDSATLTDRIRVAVALASAGDPLRFDLDRAVSTTKALIADVVESLPLVGKPQGTDIADRLWARLSPLPPVPGLLNAALILLADHDLAISTMAARVAASARALAATSSRFLPPAARPKRPARRSRGDRAASPGWRPHRGCRLQ